MAYESDDEQLEAIKKWWKENGKFTVAVIVIAIAASFGWRFWQQHQLAQAERASILYEQMLANLTQKKIDQFDHFSNLLVKDYSGTPYAKLAALTQAQLAVSDKKLNVAEEKLIWVVRKADNKAIAQIARIRAARVLLAEKKYGQALKLLDEVDDKSYLPLIEEVKGDIYAAQNEKNKAKTAYKAALTAMPKNETIRPFVEMKLAEVK